MSRLREALHGLGGWVIRNAPMDSEKMQRNPTTTTLRTVPEAFKDKKDQDAWLFINKSLERYKTTCALPNNFDEHFVRTMVFPILLNKSHPELENENVHQHLIGKLAEVVEQTRGRSRPSLSEQETWLDKQVASVKNYMTAAYPGLTITEMSGRSLTQEMESPAITIDNTQRGVTIVQ